MEPKLVMMNEPIAGLAPLITRAIFENIQRLNEEIGLTVLMIEQNARRSEACVFGWTLALDEVAYNGTY